MIVKKKKRPKIYNVQKASELSQKLGRNLTDEELKQFEVKHQKVGDLKKKIFAFMSGQNGIEKRIKDKQGHIFDIADRALNKITSKIEKFL